VRFGRDGRSHSQSSIKTFAPWHWASPARSPRQWAGRWKMAAVYCQAVLSHDQRIALDGTPAETVDAGAKDLAAKQLARLAARNAAKKAAAPSMAKPKPSTDRVRATPLRRHT
jgi:sRNA-binding protein